MREPAAGMKNWRETPAAQSALAALVVFALGFGLVAFNVIDISAGYAIETRFVDLFAAMVMAFLGRLTVIYLRRGRPRAALAIAAPFALYLVVRRMSVDFTQLTDGLAELVVRGIGVTGRAVPFASEVVTWALLIGCAIAILAAGRQLLAGHLEGSRLAQAAGTARAAARPLVPYMLLGLLAMVVLFPFAPFVDRRLLDIAILVLTYVMLGWGLNIVVGLAGLLDLGYVAFYAVGAYSFALLAHFFGFGFWICLPFAGIMSAFAGVLLGFPVLRLRGDYLAIVTLGFGEMVRIILLNWTKLTNGPDGISGIPRPTFFGLPFRASAADGGTTFHQYFGLTYATVDKFIFLYYVILVLALITNGFTLRIRKLPVGRAWEALREDETACRSLGINPHNTKLTAFGIGAMFGGLAGSFFATRQAFISPESFTFIESAVILAIVVLGGMGSQLGVVIAAVVLIGVPEFFRDLAEYRMLAFGAGMVLIMIWRPLGLLSHREPTLRLHPKTRS